jgi:hypothetical protein
MTWEAKAQARHRLESSLSESRDSDGDGASPVVDGPGPMRNAVGISPTVAVYPSGPYKAGPRQ